MYNKYQNSIYSLYTWNIEIGYTDIYIWNIYLTGDIFTILYEKYIFFVWFQSVVRLDRVNELRYICKIDWILYEK